MSNFTEKFISNIIDLYKIMFIFFGIATYPLWAIQMAANGAWALVIMLALGLFIPLGTAFLMTFTQYKDSKSTN